MKDKSADPPRICIDARWIFPRISGIGRVTEKLIGHLGETEGDEEYLVLFNDRVLKERYAARWADRPRLNCRLVPWGIYDPKSQFALPRWLAAEGADLYHSTNYFIPWSRPRFR